MKQLIILSIIVVTLINPLFGLSKDGKENLDEAETVAESTGVVAQQEREKIVPSQEIRDNLLEELRAKAPDLEVQFDPVTGCLTSLKMGYEALWNKLGQRDSASGNADTTKITHPSGKNNLEIVWGFLERYAPLMMLNNARDELKLDKKLPDDLDEIERYQFHQVWDGVPVWKTEIIVNIRSNGIVYHLKGEYYPSPQLNSAPTVSEDSAIAIVTKAYEKETGNEVYDTESKLCILYLDKTAPKLTWYVFVKGSMFARSCEYFLDANTGEVVRKMMDTGY